MMEFSIETYSSRTYIHKDNQSLYDCIYLVHTREYDDVGSPRCCLAGYPVYMA